MNNEVEARRARVFGEVAAEYARVRPGYPDALITDVLAHAGNPTRALEIGAGTGKATTAMVARGVRVTALEPDPRMAEVLAATCGSTMDIVVGSFEEHRVETPYPLLFSAQAWHWTAPETRWRNAAAALREGGTLALFWNGDRPEDPEVAARIVAAHQACAPESNLHVMDDDFGWDETGLEELEATDLFGSTRYEVYDSTRTLSGADYAAYQATTSSVRILPAARREALTAAIEMAAGRELTLTVRTALALARRR